VTAAVAYAKQSVTYADRSRGAFLPTIFRAEYAKMLHQAGRGDEALKVFEEAERMQGKRQPAYPRLYSVQGFLYCDLLLTDAERAAWQRLSDPQSSIRYPRLIDSCHTVEQRAAQTLTLAQSWRRDILSAALDHLLLGRAGLYRVILGQFAIRNHIIPNHKPGPKSEIEEAVSGLRRASYQDELPKGFLTRAWVKVLEGNADGARADLDEAWEIAARGPMRLHMADIHLYRARLFHAVMPYPWDRDEQGQPRGPKDDLAAARRLIEQCGYWRRKEELGDAEEAAKNW